MRRQEKRLNALMFKTCWNKKTLFFLNNVVNETKENTRRVSINDKNQKKKKKKKLFFSQEKKEQVLEYKSTLY
jgi:hypothetical protein